jgi:spermidine/putrescine transport system permease protein
MNPLGDTTDELRGPRRRAGWPAWLMLSPLLLWLALFVVVPTIALIAYSFATYRGFGEVTWTLSLEAYRESFDTVARRALLRAMWLAFLTTVLCVLIGYPVAYFIGRASERWRNLLLMLVMIPFWTSFLIRVYAWIIILRTEGLLNSFLLSAGAIADPLQLYPSYTAVLIGMVYSFLPFMILPIYGSVEKLDNALIEAAFDLGAGPVRACQQVIVPLTRPGIAAGILLVFIPAVGTYAISDILGGKKVDLIGNIIENQFRDKGGDWPFGSAMGVLLLVTFLVAYAMASFRRSRVEE